METESMFQIGHVVLARFTNCCYIREFKGEIVGKTKNYWKVRAIQSPYANDVPDRVFQIATIRARNYSLNNRIVELADHNSPWAETA